MSVLLLAVLLAGATARLTRLVNEDAIAAPARAAVITRFGPDSAPAYFTRCPWCVSMWIAPLLLALAWWPAHHGTAAWFWFPAAALTLSYVTGLLASAGG